MNHTSIHLIADASGSMSEHYGLIKNAVRNFYQEQSAVRHDTFDLKVTLFGNNSSTFSAPEDFLNLPIRDLGGTKLFDTVEKVLRSHLREYQRIPVPSQRPVRNIFVIITDGQDNQSPPESRQNLLEIIPLVEAHPYSFNVLFCGSNQDAYKVGDSFGIKPGKALSFASSTVSMEAVMNAISAKVTSYRQNGAPQNDQFFDSNDYNLQRKLGAIGSSLAGR